MSFQGCSAAHLAKVSPTLSIVRRASMAMQDSMPFRLCSVHCLHAPTFITNILLLFSFLKEKLINKVKPEICIRLLLKFRDKSGTWGYTVCIYLQVYLHNGGGEELHAYIDKEILPKEWGGEAGTFQELNGRYNFFNLYNKFLIKKYDYSKSEKYIFKKDTL